MSLVREIKFNLPNGNKAVAVEVAAIGKRATRWRYDDLGLEIELPLPANGADIVAVFEQATAQSEERENSPEDF